MPRYSIQTWKSRNTGWTLITFVTCCSRKATVTSHPFLSWKSSGSWWSQGSNRTLWPWWSWLTPRPLLRKALAKGAISSPTGTNELLSTPTCMLYGRKNKYEQPGICGQGLDPPERAAYQGHVHNYFIVKSWYLKTILPLFSSLPEDSCLQVRVLCPGFKVSWGRPPPWERPRRPPARRAPPAAPNSTRDPPVSSPPGPAAARRRRVE